MRVNEVDQLFACMLLYFSECLQHACSMPAAYTEGRLQVPPVRSWAIMCEPGPWWLFRSFSLVELCRPGWMPKDFAGASETWNDQTWNNQTWKPIRVGMITMHAWKLMSFHYMLPSFMFCFFNVTMHAWEGHRHTWHMKQHACMTTKPCMHETETSSMHENEAMHAWNGHADMFFPMHACTSMKLNHGLVNLQVFRKWRRSSTSSSAPMLFLSGV